MALKRKGKKQKTPHTHLKKNNKINTSPPWQLNITGQGGIFLACSISCVRLPTGSFWICERERMLCTKGSKLPGWKSDGGGPKRGGKKRVRNNKGHTNILCKAEGFGALKHLSLLLDCLFSPKTRIADW